HHLDAYGADGADLRPRGGGEVQLPLRTVLTVEREPLGPQRHKLRRGSREQPVADEAELAGEGERSGPPLGIGLLLAALGTLPGPSPAQHAPAVGVEDGLRGVEVRAEVHASAARRLEAGG